MMTNHKQQQQQPQQPAISRTSDEASNTGLLWVRGRTFGLKPPGQQMSTSNDLMLRLKEEARLDEHKGCVNCLDWNQRGDQLASGSDDSTVIIWNVFRCKKQNVVKTGHEGNIFSVKFIPNTSDTLVATGASDCKVKVTNIFQNENLLDCTSCHIDRVKRLAVHPSEPNLIWSAAEDGLILEYDIRQKHVCNSSKPNNLLIDLRSISDLLQAKCLAVNPMRSEMLAVGSNDIYNRLFDRRFIKHNAPGTSCTAYFAPGHLLKTNNRSNHIQTYGTTYLSFNSKGTELLASYHAEQVYMFNVYEPWQCFRSFESTLMPLLLDTPIPGYDARSKTKPGQHVQRLGELKPIAALSANQVDHCDNANKEALDLSVVNLLNEYLNKIQNCPDLYRSRSIALQKRGWRGDDYQALRDCCCALALDPMDSQTIYQLATNLIKLNDHDAAGELLKFIESNRSEYDDDGFLKMTQEVLGNFNQKPLLSSGSSLDSLHSSVYDPYDSLPNYSTLQRSDSALACSRSLNSDCGQPRQVTKRLSNPFDFSKRFCGHCNMNTDIKEANFFGPNDEFIVGGSDDGAFYIWNKDTTNILKAVHADHHILNCVQPNPRICMLATSGIETAVKIWSPNGSINRDVKSLEARCAQNQKFISTDPLEAMIMMLYPGQEVG
uniref:WD and tetratricopeptide repeats protein 1 n=1 Tax=Aceria tosichella TaxID=561515 RepID=A0A6G1S8I5_9ACAR